MRRKKRGHAGNPDYVSLRRLIEEMGLDLTQHAARLRLTKAGLKRKEPQWRWKRDTKKLERVKLVLRFNV